MEIQIINEQTFMIYFENKIDRETYNKVQQTVQYIKSQSISAIIDIVPSYRAIMISFDIEKNTADEIIQQLNLSELNFTDTNSKAQRLIHIPVLYGGEVGPDIKEVANYNHLTTEDVIHIHSSKEYLIYMLGFMPGFPYLGGLDERLHTPRRSEPRLSIEAGSVGIANNQTGLYPLNSPGGWQIIGKTPIQVFNKNNHPMTLYEAGDIIKFYPIDSTTYDEIVSEIESGHFNKEKWVTFKDEH